MKKIYCFLSICAVALFYGCTSDSESQDAYLEVSPVKVVFDESNPAANIITVKSNNSWNIDVASSELLLDKTSGGAGENSVTVLSIPSGKSIMMTVSSAGLQKWVTVTSKGSASVSLSVSPTEIDFNPDKPAWNVITVRSDVQWVATVSDPALEIDPMSGTGDGDRISVTAIPYGRTETVTISTARTDGGENISRTVTVSRAPRYAWVELPAKVDNDDYVYVTNYATTVKTGKSVRNYTSCYDVVRHVPRLVAYPMHACYKEGGYGRTNPDPWRPDPQLTQQQQSVIYDVDDWQNWPWANNPKPGWSKSELTLWTRCNGVYFGRGHMMASSHRGGAGSLLNIQTFYPSNIAPENMLYSSHWGTVENSIVNNWFCNDTLYVVQGTYFENDDNTVYDAGNYDRTTPGVSKICVVPTHRFTVLLRTKNGNTGKHIAECSAEEVMAIGFWFPQNFTSETPSTEPSLSEYTFSVAEIERKIGSEFSFFPLCPDGVKDKMNVADWPALQSAM